MLDLEHLLVCLVLKKHLTDTELNLPKTLKIAVLMFSNQNFDEFSKSLGNNSDSNSYNHNFTLLFGIDYFFK